MDDLHGHLYCLRGAEIVGYPSSSSSNNHEETRSCWDLWIGGSSIVAINNTQELNFNAVDINNDIKVIDCSGLIIAPGIIDLHMFICGDMGIDGYHGKRTPEANLNDIINGGITTLVGLNGSDINEAKTPLSLIMKARSLQSKQLSCYICSGAKKHTSPLPYFTTSISKDYITFRNEIVGRGIFEISHENNSIKDHDDDESMFKRGNYNDRNSCIQITPSELIREANECFHHGKLNNTNSLLYCRIGNHHTFLDPLRDLITFISSSSSSRNHQSSSMKSYILPTISGNASLELLNDCETWLKLDKGNLNISAACGVEITCLNLISHFLILNSNNEKQQDSNSNSSLSTFSSHTNFSTDQLTISSEAYLSSHHHRKTSHNIKREKKERNNNEDDNDFYSKPNILLKVVKCLYLKHKIDLKICFDLVSSNPANLLNLGHGTTTTHGTTTPPHIKIGQIQCGYDADILLLDKKTLNLKAVIKKGKFIKCYPNWIIENNDILNTHQDKDDDESCILEDDEDEELHDDDEEFISQKKKKTPLIAARDWLSSKLIIKKEKQDLCVSQSSIRNEKLKSSNVKEEEELDKEYVKKFVESNISIKNKVDDTDDDDVEEEDVRLMSPSLKRINHSKSAPRSPSFNGSYPSSSPPPPPPRSSRSSPRLTSSPPPPPPPPTPKTISNRTSSSSPRQSLSSPILRDNCLIYSKTSSTQQGGRKNDSEDEKSLLVEVEKSEQLRIRLASLRNKTKGGTNSDNSVSFIPTAPPSKTNNRSGSSSGGGSNSSVGGGSSGDSEKSNGVLNREEDDCRSETKSDARERLRREADRLNKIQEESTLNKRKKASINTTSSPTSTVSSPSSPSTSTSTSTYLLSPQEFDAEELERDIAHTLQSLATPKENTQKMVSKMNSTNKEEANSHTSPPSLKTSSSSSTSNSSNMNSNSSNVNNNGKAMTASPFKERGLSPRSSSAGRAESPERHKQSQSGFSIGSGKDTIVEIARHPSLGYEDGNGSNIDFNHHNSSPNHGDRYDLNKNDLELNSPETLKINKHIDFSSAITTSNSIPSQLPDNSYNINDQIDDDDDDEIISETDNDKNDFDLKLPEEMSEKMPEEMSEKIHQEMPEDGEVGGVMTLTERTISERTPSKDYSDEESSEEASWEGDMLDFIGRDLMDSRHPSTSIGRSQSLTSPSSSNIRSPSQTRSPSLPTTTKREDNNNNDDDAPSSPLSSPSKLDPTNPSNRLLMFSGLASNRRKSF